MRDIKFRAWCTLDNKMVEPMTIQEIIHSKKSTASLKQLNEHFIFEQFTGRTDDGGDELYDGDIISFDYELKSCEGVIEWSEALSAFVVKRKDKDPLFLYDIDDAVTKLGNKELL